MGSPYRSSQAHEHHTITIRVDFSHRSTYVVQYPWILVTKVLTPFNTHVLLLQRQFRHTNILQFQYAWTSLTEVLTSYTTHGLLLQRQFGASLTKVLTTYTTHGFLSQKYLRCTLPMDSPYRGSQAHSSVFSSFPRSSSSFSRLKNVRCLSVLIGLV